METKRLYLRPYTPEDFEDYYTYIMEPELQMMLGLHDVTDRISAQRSFDWLIQNRLFLALEVKENRRAIGHIAIHPPYEPATAIRPGRNGCSLSFAIAKEYRRQGLMEEALRAEIDFLFHNGTDYIDCEYTADNLPSRALQEKLGFQAVTQESLGFTDLVVCIIDRTIP